MRRQALRGGSRRLGPCRHPGPAWRILDTQRRPSSTGRNRPTRPNPTPPQLADHQYRGKKLIVWGATVHLMRQASAIDPNINPKNPQRPYTTMVTMGEHVWRRVGPRAYVIGFNNYEGLMGIGDPVNDKENSVRSEVEKDQDPSIELEELLNAARFDYALVDFRKPASGGEWLKTPIVSRPLASQGMRAVWPNVLDAMFFIRVMEPNLATRPPATKPPTPAAKPDATTPATPAALLRK